ncbi:hypothetical protein [Chitiniphilus eburneus]|uniref:hypothetical protein n=1 Tax=Chitiniphilus eburneus TaxID=2571148 RepID=UPI0035CEFD23
MAERPILFSAPMVRAILDGRKTQTRRVTKLQPRTKADIGHYGAGMPFIRNSDPLRPNLACPFGQPGDRLWLRESWRSTVDLDQYSGSRIAEMCLDAGYSQPWAPIQYEADAARCNWMHTRTPPHDGAPLPGRYRHARFMPRWASRLLLGITAVRIERLHDISEADAIAEGIERREDATGDWAHYLDTGLTTDAVGSYRSLWELINGQESWRANPWVWVIEFERLEDRLR